MRLLVLKSSPEPKRRPPESKLRLIFFKIEENLWYQRFILGSIILNTVVLALKWYQQPDILDQITDILNYVFTGIFTVEIFIKLMAIGF